jgi:L-lactate dehydrogenase
MQTRMMNKVVIVGAGMVGASTAYSLLLSGLLRDIVLIDLDKDRSGGEAQDLGHCAPYVPPATVRSGDYSECQDADIVVINAGAAQKKGETRLDLLNKNANIVRSIIKEIKKYTQDTLLIIVTNPVDIMTYVALKESGFHKSKVFGTGTTLDTARLRYLLGTRCRIDSKNVHAYVIGEHGDSELIVWSSANVGGVNFQDFAATCDISINGEIKEEINHTVRNAAYEIIQKKGATYWGIASATTRIISAIVRNQNAILPLSVYIDNFHGIKDVCFSLPSVVNRNGVERIMEIMLNDEELQALKLSANTLIEARQEMD